MTIPRKPLTPQQNKLQLLKDKKKSLRQQLINLATNTEKAESLLNEIEKVTLEIRDLDQSSHP
jgi:chaperonin cofactor prefoldin